LPPPPWRCWDWHWRRRRHSRAQTANWTGANSTDWFDFINNWAFAFPTNADEVVIDTVNPDPTVVDSHVPGAEALNVSVGVSSTGMLTIQNGGTANFFLTSIIGDQSIRAAR
jgi:hypothetical protein